jgi:hypothetical protein
VNAERFDATATAIAAPMSRRRVLKLLLAGAVAGVALPVRLHGTRRAEAALCDERVPRESPPPVTINGCGSQDNEWISKAPPHLRNFHGKADLPVHATSTMCVIKVAIRIRQNATFNFGRIWSQYVNRHMATRVARDVVLG